MDFLIAISIISFALLVSAFISASESSIIAVNKIRIKHLDQEEGNKRAAAVTKILEQHDYFFGSILLIGNIMNILIATVSTSFIISVLGQNSGFAIILASIIFCKLFAGLPIQFPSISAYSKMASSLCRTR